MIKDSCWLVRINHGTDVTACFRSGLWTSISLIIYVFIIKFVDLTRWHADFFADFGMHKL